MAFTATLRRRNAYLTRLGRAAAFIAEGGAADPVMASLVREAAAALHRVRPVDLENLLHLSGDEAVLLPLSGCSVGGGIAALRFDRDDARKRRSAIRDHNRHVIRVMTEITAEGSAAGYDSHGMTISVFDLESGEVELVRARTSGDIDERGYLTIANLLAQKPEIEEGRAVILVAGAQTRAATQGDNMYSSANAHLHYEWMTREVFDAAMNEEELRRFRDAHPLVADRMGPFSVGHNGDVNSKIRWERYFHELGFRTDADSDSKEIPRILRMVHECLMADRILGTEQRFLRWFLGELEANKVLHEPVEIEVDGQKRRLGLQDQTNWVLRVARRLGGEGASPVAVACACAALLITFVDATSIYVFETITPLRVREDSPLPATVILRGPKAGGAVLYADDDDPDLPIKFASTLSNMRAQIERYDDERREILPVDYVASGARVLIREGKVRYWSLADWEMAEVVPSDEDPRVPELRFYSCITGRRIHPERASSPIIDYRLSGMERKTQLKAEGAFAGLDPVERTVTYDTVLGEITTGPTAILRKQVKDFPTVDEVEYAVDNQYGAEILLSAVTLHRNTRNLFDYALAEGGAFLGDVELRPEALFRRAAGGGGGKELREVLRSVKRVFGLAEGTSRNMLGLAFSAANLEGLRAVDYAVAESNLARIESPRLCEDCLLAFVSNSGSTKPVVALAEECIARFGKDGSLRPGQGPHVWAVTNLVTSELAHLAGQDLGASVTNLPWEKAVGSTFAAFTAFQNLLAMLVHLHESRGAIRPRRAQHLYRALASFPEVCRRTLSFERARAEIDRVAAHVAGNNLDISFVGAFGGWDATEGALKFAEMMQHNRVKFYSGAYEQHGQRATYLRSLHADPGNLVVMHIPNLETSIGSWMAQLIKEDRPRAGCIVAIAAEEDAAVLRESGADFVIPAPRGTTENLFTDALTKLVLDNMLTEAAIEAANGVARVFTGWGRRLLEASPQAASDEIPAIRKHLSRFRVHFERMAFGDGVPGDRSRAVGDVERMAVDGLLTPREKEERLAAIYKDGRRLAIMSAARRDRIVDLLSVLLDEGWAETAGERAYFSLLDDFVLELSDRNLAMELADLRYGDDPVRANFAVHYQGLAKVIGANPIKPDNIAKFQQGWGIPTFLLPPGQRRSDVEVDLASAVRRDGEDLRVDRDAMVRFGFERSEIDRLCAFGEVFDVLKRIELDVPEQGGWTFCRRGMDTAPRNRFQLAPELVQRVANGHRSAVHITGFGRNFQAQIVAVDRFGDLAQAMLLVGETPSLASEERARIMRGNGYVRRRVEKLENMTALVPPGERSVLMNRLGLVDYLTLDDRGLVERFQQEMQKDELLRSLPFQEVFAHFGVDLSRVGLENLQTLRNVFRAVRSIRGGAVYDVEVAVEDGETVRLARRDVRSLWGETRGTESSFDEPNRLKGNKKIAATFGALKMGYGKDGAHVIILPVLAENGEVGRLVLLHPEIDESLDRESRRLTLGEKYERIVNAASEYVEWKDELLDLVSMTDLMMLSDEEIADDRIVPAVRGSLQ